MNFKIKIDPADKIFSLYIRYRDKWQCKRCFKQFEEGAQYLQNSHYFSRGNESTRFDDENCDGICYGCHSYFHREPEEYRLWKIKQLGQKKYDQLTLRKHLYKKKDRKMELIIAKALLKKEKENYIKTLDKVNN